jgi:hypothetical protein
MIGELQNSLHKSAASQWIVDVFSASHALTTGVAYIQYFHEHKQEVITAVQKSLDIIIDQQKRSNMEVTEHPHIAMPKPL